MTKLAKNLLMLLGLFIILQTIVFAADVKITDEHKTVGFRGTFFDMVDDPWDYPGNEKKVPGLLRMVY